MINLDILHEDDSIVVVNKPSGILVTPDRWDKGIPTIQDMLREYMHRNSGVQHPNVRVVHRLDKDTSGVLIIAKNIKAQTYLSKQFENGEVNKTYHAIVRGVIPQQEGVINFSLAESDFRAGTMVVSEEGKKSITLFTVMERFREYTLVEAKPLTGRTHQVRVHFSALGYPLALDPFYGVGGPVFLSQLKHGYKPKDVPEKPIFSRLPLHAFRISFKEPTEGNTLLVEAPHPKDFSRMLKLLRKYS